MAAVYFWKPEVLIHVPWKLISLQDDVGRINFNVAYSPKTARTRNSHVIVDALVDGTSRNSCMSEKKARSSVYPGSDDDARTDSDRLFQTDAAAAGKARLPIVALRVREPTSADVLEERSRRRASTSETRCRSDAR